MAIEWGRGNQNFKVIHIKTNVYGNTINNSTYINFITKTKKTYHKSFNMK